MEQLLQLGFEPFKCERALAVAQQDVQLAIEFVLANSAQPEEWWRAGAVGAPGAAAAGGGGPDDAGLPAQVPAADGGSAAPSGVAEGLPPNERAHEFLNLAKRFDWEAVEEALKAEPSLVNVQPSRRWSALHQAARSNNRDAVAMLLRCKANALAVSAQNETPRQLTTSDEIAELLLQAEKAADAPRRRRRQRPEAELQERPRTFTQRFALATELSPIVGGRSAPYTRGADVADVLAGLQAASSDPQAVEHYGAENMQRQFESLRDLLARDLSPDPRDAGLEPEPHPESGAAASASPAPLQVRLRLAACVVACSLPEAPASPPARTPRPHTRTHHHHTHMRCE
eukprot:COSAG02_NODE_9087_length_2336_cov_1.527939_2_plen_343_part_00